MHFADLSPQFPEIAVVFTSQIFLALISRCLRKGEWGSVDDIIVFRKSLKFLFNSDKTGYDYGWFFAFGCKTSELK